MVTGLSAFQFADDKVRALTEARRVSRSPVVVIFSRVSESGITLVFKPLFPLFSPEAPESMKHSGMFALSELGTGSRRYWAPGWITLRRCTEHSRVASCLLAEIEDL